MRATRIDLALLSGAVVLPSDGRIAVLRPVMGDDLTAFPKARVTVLTGFRPDHDHFAGLGYATAPAAPYAAALVCLPRSKALARAMVAQAMAEVAPGGPVLVDGQKTDGIDSLIKDLRGAGVQVGEPVSKAHGRLAVVAAGQPLPADWVGAARQVADGFWTAPGVFSADGPDAGSALLAAALPASLPGRVADLGAGWGFLTRAILQRTGVREVEAVEAEAAALDCLARSISDPRLTLHWADVRSHRAARPWGAVVMNPPFHTGRAAEPDLGLAFIRAAHQGLAVDGQLWMVANRQLPYEAALAGLFRKVERVEQGPVYKVIHAAGPIRAR
jgi:16S rRNA (guanine1207-N2)-methyltransferase